MRFCSSFASAATLGSAAAASARASACSAARIAFLHPLVFLLLAEAELLRLRDGRDGSGHGRARARGRRRRRGLLRHLPLRVVRVRDDAAAAVEGEQLRRDAVEQVAVVRDQHQRARELEQALLQHLERRDVEVVRGLVEQQHVGGLQHQPRDQHARLLAAGEPAHRRVELLGAEQEALRPAGHVDRPALEDDGVAVRRQRALQRDARDRAASGAGRTSTTRRFGALLDGARVGRLLPGQQAQQRRLAAAVARRAGRAACPATAPGRGRGMTARSPNALAQALRDQQALRPALGRRRTRCRPTAVRERVSRSASSSLQPPGLVDARLRLARARLGLARQPLELAAHAVAQRLLVRRLARQQLVLLLQVLAVAAAHVEQALGERAVQLDHAAGHGLQEVAVVADREERLGLALQQLLQPEDAVEVEVVRGLVEQQQLGLAHQLARDGEPLLPAARERRDGRGLVLEARPCPARSRCGRRPRARRSAALRARARST